MARNVHGDIAEPAVGGHVADGDCAVFVQFRGDRADGRLNAVQAGAEAAHPGQRGASSDSRIGRPKHVAPPSIVK